MLRQRLRLAHALVILSGVFAAHAFGYLLAHPDPLLRDRALQGHGYQSMLSALLVPAAAVGFAWLAVHGARSVGLGSQLRPTRLAAWQAGAFLVVEVLERVPHNAVGDVLHEPAIPIGLVLQLPIALLFVGAIRAASRIVRSVIRPAPPRRIARPAPCAVTLAWVWSPVGSEAPAFLTDRGPPVVVVH